MNLAELQALPAATTTTAAAPTKTSGLSLDELKAIPAPTPTPAPAPAPRAPSSPYDTGSPLTSPVFPSKPTDSPAAFLGKTLVNAPTSLIRTAKDVGSSVLNIFNPNLQNNTLAKIAKTGAGAVEKIAGRISGKPIQSEDTQQFDAIVQGLKDRYGSIDNIKRTISEDPAGVALDIAAALEGGGALAEKGGLETTGKVLRTAGESVNPVRVLAKPAGEATAATGRATSAGGRALFSTAITPNTAEAERILRYEAKVPFLKRVGNAISGDTSELKPVLRSDTALEKRIFGRSKDIGVQAKRYADDIWANTIQPAIKGSDATVSKEDLFKPIEDRIASTAEPGRKQALTDAYDAIKDEYKNVDKLSLDDAQKIKRGLDEFTPDKVFRGQSIANEYRTLKNDMAHAIRQKTYDALKDKNIRRSYLDYGNLKELEKVGVKAITEAGTKGGFGGFWSTMWDKATTPVKTIGGQVLYRVGNKLEFLGEKGIKNFGQFLSARGFENPDAKPVLQPKTPNGQ